VLALGKSLRDAAARKPNDPDYEPIRRGELADDGLVNWHTKGWVLKFTASELVGLNGPMRTDVQQAALIPYLRDRGFNIKVVAFTTPPEICAQRPPRPDRFEEDTNPTVILRRIEIWYKQTLPVIEAFPRYGISVKHGNLLGIDNTDLTPRQTAARILAFVGLPPMADQLFPEE
jgi:adenylate kinase family enzyme